MMRIYLKKELETTTPTDPIIVVRKKITVAETDKMIQAVKMHELGVPAKKIAEKLRDVPYSTVLYWIGKFENDKYIILGRDQNGTIQ